MERTKLSRRPYAPVVLLLCCGVVALLLTRCGNNTPASGTFGSVYQALQNNNCQQCHVPGGNNNGSTLDFSTQAKAFTTLTQNKVTGGVGKNQCGNVAIVVAGNPQQSYFPYEAFGQSDSATWSPANARFSAPNQNCVPVTHVNVSPSAAEETSIIAWINNNTPNN